MAFKVTLSNYSSPQGLGASFWTAGSYQMSSLASPWYSSDYDSDYYAEIYLYKSGSAVPIWGWVGIIPTDGRQYTLDVGNSNLIDNGPLSGGSPPVITFYSDTYIFNNGVGGPVTLYWQVTGANSVRIDQGIGSVANSGQRNVNVIQTTVFTLTAVNGYGTVTAQVIVTVNAAPPPQTGPPIVLALTSTPNPVQKGQAAELYWEVDPNGLTTNVTIDNGIGSVPNTGVLQIPNMQQTKIYTLTAVNSKGTVTWSVVISVVNVIDYFTVTPSSILQGASALLSWHVSGAQDSISIDGLGNVPASGTQQVTPSSTTTYTLRIEGPAGEITAEARVIVQVGVAILSFTADKTSIESGESVVLNWETSGAVSAMVEYGAGQGQVPVNGQTEIGPLFADTIVTLTVQGAGGPVTRTLQISVAAGLSPVITSFTANPSSVAAGGGSVVLSWSVTGALDVSIDHGIGSVDAAGQVTIPVTQATVFTLTAHNLFGDSVSQVSVAVGSVLPPPAIGSFTAVPSSGAAGPVVLSWSVTGALDVSIDHGIGSVDASGQITIQVAKTTIYTLTAHNLFGTSTAHVTVTIGAPATTNTALIYVVGGAGALLLVALALGKRGKKEGK